MFLRDVIMDGFKCYNHKTTIKNIDPSFTAITGLNGSGKSNIIDAIVFTLDLSSSRNMRVSSLKELINIARKDCSVTLVFDNSIKEKSPVGYECYSQIEIYRSLDSDGKSKYKINNHPATKNSIESLCKSMGITGDFVVMQGQITKIVNMKRNDLKNMIEETAGTKNYSEERERSLSLLEKKEFKLKEAREHLKRTISPFFEELKREKHNYDENRELQARRGEYEEELVGLERELVEAEISERVEELWKVGVEYWKGKEELKSLEGKIKGRGGINKENRKREERERRKRIKEELASISALLAEKIRERGGFNHTAYAINTGGLSAENTLGQLKEKEKILSKSLINNNGGLDELETLKRTKGKMAVELKMLRSDHRAVSKDDFLLLEENLLRKAKINKLNYEISQLKSKLIYPTIEGVFGTVDENFEILDEKHKEAILTALGGKGKFVICKDDLIASKIIQNSERKISCIPLNKISYLEPKRIPYRCINAVEGIRYKKEVEGAMKYVFGGFYLFEDGKAAAECCFECGVMCITMDGTVYDPRGTLTGGKVERLEIVKNGEIRRLEEERRGEEEKQIGEEELKELGEAVELEKRIIETERELFNTEERIRILEGILKSSIDVKGELKRIREEIIETSKEKQREEERGKRIKKLDEEIEEIERQKKGMEREIGEEEEEEEIEDPGVVEERIKALIKETVKFHSRISKIAEELRGLINDNNLIFDNDDLIFDNDTTESVINLLTLEFNIEKPLFFFRSNPINKNSHNQRVKSLKSLLSKNSTPGMDPSCFELLEKNSVAVQDLESKIIKLESDRLEILKSIERINSMSLKENLRAFQHINKTLPVFLSYFLKNSDGCINENYEIRIKVGTWKNSLEELSGGQKSLVALCLIFSMLTFSPAPFYIFDEIDAALDLNYTQFIGEIIKKEFKGAQFIVVSLKNNMFDSANRVFRVFIEDQRSKICAVK